MDRELDIWLALHDEAIAIAAGEPLLAGWLKAALVDQPALEDAVAHLLASRIGTAELSAPALKDEVATALREAPGAGQALRLDLTAIVDRDPAADSAAHAFLNHKGFHALALHRVAHHLWQRGRRSLAHALAARSNDVFAIDIHPAARIGAGVFIDHGTGVVIGETAVVGDDVSILQGVTLGGTGKEAGDRHPKIGRGVLIGAHATILGNLHVGDGAKIGAGSVVLKPVRPHTTVVGVPAREVGVPLEAQPGLEMDQVRGCDL